MQRVIAEIGGRLQELDLPGPAEQIWSGVQWGRFEVPLTPAFWVSQAWMSGSGSEMDHRLGASLTEEIVFCLLGGHGTPAEVGVAASKRVCAALSARGSSAAFPQHELEMLLREPLLVRGRAVRYRFAAQRARYLAAALVQVAELNDAALDDVELRGALCALPGIGPKTASWIVRNRRCSDKVAILDIHIVRACVAMGVFPRDSNPATRYYDLERRFLQFCEATWSRASVMDAVMWTTMRRLSRALLRQLLGSFEGSVGAGGLH